MLILSQIEVNWKVVIYATNDSKRANTIKKAVNGGQLVDVFDKDSWRRDL